MKICLSVLVNLLLCNKAFNCELNFQVALGNTNTVVLAEVLYAFQSFCFVMDNLTAVMDLMRALRHALVGFNLYLICCCVSGNRICAL